MKRINRFISDKEYTIKKKLHTLKFVGWECTKKCNLNCLHCYMSANNQEDINEMSTQEVKDVFSDLTKCCNPLKVDISVTGGEPLVRADFLEIIEHVKGLGFNWILTTNGTLINKEMAKKIVKFSPINISISIDGMKKAHNYLRKDSRAFDKALLGIDNLIKAHYNSEDLIIKTVLYPKNVDDIEALYRLLLAKKIKRWHLLTILKIGRASLNYNELFVKSSRLKRINNIIQKIKKDGKINIIFNENDNFLENNINLNIKKQCLSGINFFCILYNGDIVGCVNSFRNKNTIQGNVKRDNIGDIWENKFQVNRDKKWNGCQIHNINKI